MTKARPTVLLISGGIGVERDVSLRGAAAVLGYIDPEKYNVTAVTVEKDGSWLTEGEEAVFPVRLGNQRGLLIGGKIRPVDCAIPLLHGEFGEDGRIQGTLEVAGIPLIGADTVTGAVCIDKGYTRAIAHSLGIPTARGVSLPAGADTEAAMLAAEELGYPVFVKPTRLGSSVGASEARTESELAHAFTRARVYGTGVLIEELVTDKRELEVGVLATKNGTVISPVGEVICHGFYDYGTKYRTGAPTVCPADIDPEIAATVREYAARLADALSLRGPSRIDLFLSGDRLLFNEVNTMPGFTAGSLYPQLMTAAGIPPRRLFDLLISEAVGA